MFDSETPRFSKIATRENSGLSREERCSSTCHLSTAGCAHFPRAETFNLDLNEIFSQAVHVDNDRAGLRLSVFLYEKNRDGVQSIVDHTNCSWFSYDECRSHELFMFCLLTARQSLAYNVPRFSLMHIFVQTMNSTWLVPESTVQ